MFFLQIESCASAKFVSFAVIAEEPSEVLINPIMHYC